MNHPHLRGVTRFVTMGGSIFYPQIGEYNVHTNISASQIVYNYTEEYPYALDGICDEIQVDEETLLSNEFRENPIFRVVEFGESLSVRLRPEMSHTQSPLMKELAADGFSEYIAMPLSASGEKYNSVTLATQQAGGFRQTQRETLTRLLDIFALHSSRI